MADVRKNREPGYILLGVVILMALGAVIIAGNLDLASSNAMTTNGEILRNQEFYRTEESLNFATSWLRSFSTSLASAFSRNTFYSKFDRTAPTIGANDTSLFQLPTRIKLQGTNNSVILANNASVAASAFPPMVDTVTGVAFNPVSGFQAASLGQSMVRVTLVDVMAVDPTKDYGDPDTGAMPPATDFNPVYRIDSMRSTTGGGHVFGYFIGSLVFNYGVGFYGQDALYISQDCDSYLSNSGAYDAATNRRANCATGSSGSVGIKNTEKVFGTLRTTGTVNTSNPWGDPNQMPPIVCADFNCTKKGQVCSGAQCTVSGFGNYSKDWLYYQTNYGGTPLQDLDGGNIPPGYYSQITVGPNVEARFASSAATTSTYYIANLNLANNAKLYFDIGLNAGQRIPIKMYVNRFTGDKFNGNQLINLANKPYDLRVFYLGSWPLTIDGTADLSMFLEAPNATVTVSGSGGYFGGLKSKALYFTGSSSLHYDESGDVTTLADVSYKLRDVVARYR